MYVKNNLYVLKQQLIKIPIFIYAKKHKYIFIQIRLLW